MLNHAVSVHPEMHPNEVEFGMSVMSHHKTAFERQLKEAIEIRRGQGSKLLNSKLEYNRCYIPKITVKIYEKEKSNPDHENEKKVKDTIKMMRKKWKKRSDEKEDLDDEKPAKRRKDMKRAASSPKNI